MALDVSISVIAGFSADQRVCRAFGHLIGYSAGQLLLVPQALAMGDLRQVTDVCPIPWSEVWSALDTMESDPQPVPPHDLCREYPHLASITPYGWQWDPLALGASQSPSAHRLTHPSGIRFVTLVAPGNGFGVNEGDGNG